MNQGEREESPQPRTSRQCRKLQTPTGPTRKPHEEQMKNKDSQQEVESNAPHFQAKGGVLYIHTLMKLQPGPINE